MVQYNTQLIASDLGIFGRETLSAVATCLNMFETAIEEYNEVIVETADMDTPEILSLLKKYSMHNDLRRYIQDSVPSSQRTIQVSDGINVIVTKVLSDRTLYLDKIPRHCEDSLEIRVLLSKNIIFMQDAIRKFKKYEL